MRAAHALPAPACCWYGLPANREATQKESSQGDSSCSCRGLAMSCGAQSGAGCGGYGCCRGQNDAQMQRGCRASLLPCCAKSCAPLGGGAMRWEAPSCTAHSPLASARTVGTLVSRSFTLSCTTERNSSDTSDARERAWEGAPGGRGWVAGQRARSAAACDGEARGPAGGHATGCRMPGPTLSKPAQKPRTHGQRCQSVARTAVHCAVLCCACCACCATCAPRRCRPWGPPHL